jgi:lysophospholipase L1-like esterase
MIDCLILGDSIAVGTQMFRPECEVLAKGGINSHQWNKKYSNQSFGAKTVIISLGSNDHPAVRTIWELQEIRRRVQADKVFWILPAIKPDIQQMVKLVANDYGDTVLPINRLQADQVHPSWAGYKSLAEQTK